MHSMHRGHSFAEIYRLTPTRELTEDEEKPACPPTSQGPLRTIGPDALQIPKVAVAVEHRDQHLVRRLPKMVRTDPFLYQVSVIRARRPGCRPHLRGVLPDRKSTRLKSRHSHEYSTPLLPSN